MGIPVALRRQVHSRARGRCEYCGLSVVSQDATFHMDHIVPEAAGGATTLENLALACVSCSLSKGARQFALDPLTAEPAPLFNPRQQPWDEHFQWNDLQVTGLTPTGRATVNSLRLNRGSLLRIRAQERFFHRHPPPP